MKKLAAAFIALTLVFSSGLALEDPSFRHEFPKIASSAFAALATLAKEDNRKRQ